MNKGPNTDSHEECILVLAPLRRDAPTVAAILTQAGLSAKICRDLAELCKALTKGAGAALIAEEALTGGESMATLRVCLEGQPPWSEPPIVVVTSGRGRRGAREGVERFAGLGNVMVLERPLRSATLVSALRSALRARRRQYQVRDHLRERELTAERLRAQEEELRRLNETLEQRVHERTVELEEANSRLVAEIEQRQQAERALRQAQKMEAVGQLTGGVAHDFNNILMAFSAGLDMLERATDPVRRERIFSGMRQAGSRGEVLTRQLLAFSRRMALSPEAINLRSLLEGMHILVAGALRGDIVVDIKIPPDLWPVMADPTQLELAILNTAVNARDAMPRGGTLTIAARNARLDGTGESGLAGDFVRIEIRDTGTGIPPEIFDRVFDPFFTTKAVGKGTGLGLSQVYGFAKQSGGNIKIRSSVGEGTSMILHLPRAAALAADTGALAPERRVPEYLADGPRTVLLVEDNDEVAVLAAEMLEGLGFTVKRVSSAPAALAALENGRAVDLVFSDIVMPGGMNGIELARELKRRQPKLPIILTTGYCDAARDGEAIQGLALLRKPYRLHALEAALKAAMTDTRAAAR
jgi:signal transduction histidine kinase/CheY-like chemotaxis protein